MREIRTLVIDDEPLAGQLIAGYVNATPYLMLVAVCTDSLQALSLINDDKVDLVYSDIQMPDLNGIDLSQSVYNKDVKFVFTTAFAQYAIDGYKVAALDYLMKPISYKDFLSASDRAKGYFEKKWQLKTIPSDHAIFLKVDGQLRRLNICDIMYVESKKDYVIVHCADGSSAMSLVSIKKIEESFDKNCFFRVNRSFLVAMDKVFAIENGKIVFGKERITISANARDDFFKALAEKNVIFV
ncbi:MAG: response regulator transcription factor [Bacteroidales bacterium]|nr:response regulator transcription factor [Bacteroidales bacterium]